MDRDEHDKNIAMILLSAIPSRSRFCGHYTICTFICLALCFNCSLFFVCVCFFLPQVPCISTFPSLLVSFSPQLSLLTSSYFCSTVRVSLLLWHMHAPRCLRHFLLTLGENMAKCHSCYENSVKLGYHQAFHIK